MRLRAATAADQPTISQMVRAAGINPMDLKWRNFVVAEDEATGQVIGLGQIKRHRDGSAELASIVTAPERRGQGVASQVIRHLLASHTGELYLTCVDRLGPFYERFGFVAVDRAEMPPYFRRLERVAQALHFLDHAGRRLLVMRHAPET